MKYCRGPQRSVCVKVWSWSQDIRTVPSRCSQSAAGHILTVAARNDCLGPERSESEWGVDDVCLVELRFWGSMGTILFSSFFNPIISWIHFESRHRLQHSHFSCPASFCKHTFYVTWELRQVELKTKGLQCCVIWMETCGGVEPNCCGLQ